MGYISGTLHWSVVEADLGVGGVSYVEMLILYELWGGKRLVLEKLCHGIVDLVAEFQCQLFFLVQALIFGVGSWGLLCDLCALYLVVLVGSFLVGLGLIIVG